MLFHSIFTLVLAILSIKSVFFLRVYTTLVLSGLKAVGRVIAFEGSGSLMTKNANIPKIQFLDQNGQSIIGKPIYSWLLELNFYGINKNNTEYYVFYDSADPKLFVVRSHIEFLTNVFLVVAAVVLLVWLIVKVFS